MFFHFLKDVLNPLRHYALQTCQMSLSGGTKAMSTNPEFISPCGLNCGVCAIYIAHRDNNIKLKATGKSL
jgi:hypothetical protein